MTLAQQADELRNQIRQRLAQIGGAEEPQGAGSAKLSEWEESKHPRSKDGEFANKGASGEGGSSDEPPAGERVSWEAVPSTQSPVLPGIHNATYEQKIEYIEAVKRQVNDSGLKEKLGLPEPIEEIGPGWWEGVSNPSLQATFPPEADPEMIKAYAAAVGSALHQDGVGMHSFRPASSTEEANIVAVQLARPVHATDVTAVATALGNSDLYVVCGGNELRVLNGAGLDNNEFTETVRSALAASELGRAKVRLLQGDLDFVGSADYGGLIGGSDAEKHDSVSPAETGADGDRELGFGESRRSDIQEAARVLHDGVQKVRQEFARRYGWGDPVREAQLTERSSVSQRGRR